MYSRKVVLVSLGFMLGIAPAIGQLHFKRHKKPAPPAAPAPKPPDTSPEGLIQSGAKVDSGLFNVYNKDGKFYLEIADSLLGRDFLSVTRIARGAADIRVDMMGYAGDEVNNNVIRFDKNPSGDKLFLRQISFSEMSRDSTQQMYRSVAASNLQPIVAAFDIKGHRSDKKTSVIDLTEYLNGDNDILFLSSMAHQLLHLAGPQPDKSYIETVRSFRQNTEIKTLKTYGRVPTGNFGGIMTFGPGGSTITLELNTSIVALPEKPMQPRYADHRIGYFTVDYTDFDLDPQGVKDIQYIKRWRLEPKPTDIAAYKAGKLVEPAHPIVFYIDPTTPKKWVPYLIKGVEDWNVAFEKAGFKNAIVAREVPADDTTWSIDDASHNAIVYKPSTIANASGPSISDPRTGEILESHINWYHNVMELLHDWYMIQAGASDPAARKPIFDDTLMGQLIRFVSSHEVGHTLGLLHNFGSSATVPVDSLRSKAWVEAHGHTPSIMDYARFNYVAQPEDHIGEAGLFPRIGDYDKWAIEWGYRLYPDLSSAEAEKQTLASLVKDRLENPRLRFGSEMLINTDPRDQNEDLGDDAVKASTYGIRNLQFILPRLPSWSLSPGEDYSGLTRTYNALVGQFSQYTAHVVRQVGGMYVTEKNSDQPGPVFTPVARATQAGAVAFLDKELFATPTWLLDTGILNRIGKAPVPLVAGLQYGVLDRLLSLGVITKLTETGVYPPSDLLRDLHGGIWGELKENSKVSIYRRGLQSRYVDDMITLMTPYVPGPMPPRSSAETMGLARVELSGLLQLLVKAQAPDPETRAHWVDLTARIRKALSVKE